MSTLTIRRGRECLRFNFDAPAPINRLLQEAGCFIPQPCGGNHTCGKCLIKARGALSPRTTEEARLCPTEPAVRLACCAQALGDAEVTLETESRVDVLMAQQEQNALEQEPVGFAVDIGTTTVAVYLCGLTSGAILAREGELNRQSAFGADVIARIDASSRQKSALQNTIVGQLQEMFAACLRKCVLPSRRVTRLVLTGNTTMLHFLTGQDASGIAAAPFTPTSLFGASSDAGELFPEFSGARLFLPRCISAYVGADITCAILSSRLTTRYKNALLVDVGTNGEMALWSGGRLYCCSTAAGPAFEGAGLVSGMTAAPGAVTHISLKDGKPFCRVLGDVLPTGLCGTGALSALAFLLDQNVLDETGRLQDEDHDLMDFLEDTDTDRLFRFAQNGPVLTQADVRQLQLAKAAIAAGAASLLHEAGVDSTQLDALILCGGFGCRLDPGEAQRVGLLPPMNTDRILTAGNASGQGAVELLLHPEQEQISTALAQSGETVDLSSSPFFMERYVDEMFFHEDQ